MRNLILRFLLLMIGALIVTLSRLTDNWAATQGEFLILSFLVGFIFMYLIEKETSLFNK